MKYVLAAIMVISIVSCASVDIQKRVKTQARAGAAGNPSDREIIAVPIDERPPPQIVERPVYVPSDKESGKPAAKQPDGIDVTRAAMGGILQPQDYEHAAIIYDYDDNWVYEVYCQPLRATDIRLQNGEKIAEPPFISDSERWKVGAGVSYEDGDAVQHVYIKPNVSRLEASLIINTDRRVYHLILRSYNTVHMPKVRWRYPGNSLPRNFAAAPDPNRPAAVVVDPDAAIFADPRFLSFNYRVTYALFRKPRWLPKLAYDDGKKTYITFPEESLQAELPAVFENRADVVNYRVARNVIVIDKLIEAVTVRIGKRSVVIRKQKGKP
jgi:type IV secretion system protein VirB9